MAVMALSGICFVLLCTVFLCLYVIWRQGLDAENLAAEVELARAERDRYKKLAEDAIRAKAEESGPTRASAPTKRPYVAPEMEILPASCESCQYSGDFESDEEPCRSCWAEYIDTGIRIGWTAFAGRKRNADDPD